MCDDRETRGHPSLANCLYSKEKRPSPIFVTGGVSVICSQAPAASDFPPSGGVQDTGRQPLDAHVSDSRLPAPRKRPSWQEAPGKGVHLKNLREGRDGGRLSKAEALRKRRSGAGGPGALRGERTPPRAGGGGCDPRAPRAPVREESRLARGARGPSADTSPARAAAFRTFLTSSRPRGQGVRDPVVLCVCPRTPRRRVWVLAGSSVRRWPGVPGPHGTLSPDAPHRRPRPGI